MAIEVIEKILPYKITLTRRTGVSPNIYYYFTLKTKVYRGSTKTEDPKEAKKVAIKIYHEVDSGKTKTKSPKFDAIVSKFINYKKNYVTNETIEGYEYRSQFLMEFFRGKDIEAIDKNAFYEYQEWRTNYHVNKKKSRKDKRTLTVGNASINRDLGLLVSILRFAKEELNLLGKVKVPKWKALPEKTRNEILSSQEIDSLRAYWLKKKAFYWDIMNFILNTGLRYPSEINKLKWKNIMLDKRLMFIKRKSRLADKDKYFPVQIYDEAYEILIKLKNRNVPTGLEDFVFVDEEGKQIANIKKGFRASLKACGIDKHFPMFCFRHQFATEMTARGVPPKALSEQMGHKSLRMVDGTYTHLMREHHAIIAERIGMDKNGHKQAEIVKRFKDDWVLTEDFGKGMTEEEFLEFERKINSSEEFQDMLKNHFNNK